MRLRSGHSAFSFLALVTLASWPTTARSQSPSTVSSPDRRNAVTVDVKEGALRYSEHARAADREQVATFDRLLLRERGFVAVR